MTLNGWNITENIHSNFTASNGIYKIIFNAEYRNGLYFNVLSYTDIKKNRSYKAYRYLIKPLNVVSDLSWELLKAGKLWDYKNQRPALETYKKDIKPYYDSCIKNGLPLYGDRAFLKELFK